MESRIILSRADFSTNNVGRYFNLNDFTKKVLAKQTQYDETCPESDALNTFLANLKLGGFIGGDSPLINSLFIPALAASHDELLYDICNLDENGYPTDAMNANEKSAESANRAYLLYKNANGKTIGIIHSGVIASNHEEEFVTKHFNVPASGLAVVPSFSLVTYGANTVNNETNRFLLSVAARQVDLISNKVVLRHLEQSYSCESTISLTNSKGFIGISCIKGSNSYSFEGLLENGTISASSETGSATDMYLTTLMNTYKVGQYYTDSTRRYASSLMIFADYITPEKMYELKGYIDPLMVALHVKTA